MKTSKPITEYYKPFTACLCWHCGQLHSCPLANKDREKCRFAWYPVSLLRIHSFFSEYKIRSRITYKRYTINTLDIMLTRKGVPHFVKGEKVYFPVYLEKENDKIKIQRRG